MNRLGRESSGLRDSLGGTRMMDGRQKALALKEWETSWLHCRAVQKPEMSFKEQSKSWRKKLSGSSL